MIELISIDTPALGDRSYLATDGRVALVVDPQRDIDRVLAAAARRGVRITHVFETHIHNDYVTGGLALARVTGAAYHVNAADEVGFDRVPVGDGDAIGVGDAMTVAGDRHARAYLHPPVVRAAGRRHRPGGRGVHRRVAAVRLDRAAGPARPGTPGRPGRRAARLGPAAGRGAARRHAGLSRRTGSAASAPPLRRQAHRPPRSARRSGQPGAAPGRGAVRRRNCWPDWTPTRRTTRTWARPTRPGRTASTCRRPPWPTPAQLAAAHRGRRVGRRPAQPPRVRRRARRRIAQLRARQQTSPPTSAG